MTVSDLNSVNFAGRPAGQTETFTVGSGRVTKISTNPISAPFNRLLENLNGLNNFGAYPLKLGE